MLLEFSISKIYYNHNFKLHFQTICRWYLSIIYWTIEYVLGEYTPFLCVDLKLSDYIVRPYFISVLVDTMFMFNDVPLVLDRWPSQHLSVECDWDYF